MSFDRWKTHRYHSGDSGSIYVVCEYSLCLDGSLSKTQVVRCFSHGLRSCFKYPEISDERVMERYKVQSEYLGIVVTGRVNTVSKEQ